MTDSAAADLERADALVAQALAVAPGSALVHLVKGHVLGAQNRWEQIIPEFETALTLNRNLLGALQGLGQSKLLAESIDEVISLEKARSAMPASPVFRARLASRATPNALPPNSPKTRALYDATYFAGLRKAGMPEE
jgi:tetratricopeptide (TPR) repeat protein